MGTSSSYKGPGKRPNLIPPWADDGALPGEEPQPQPDGRQPVPPPDTEPLPDQPSYWPSLKALVGRAAAAGLGGSGASAGKIAAGYVRALGGSRNAARAAVTGIPSGAGLASFLAQAGATGLETTLASLNLPSLAADGVESVMLALADLLAPPGAEREDAITRDAVMETLRDWEETYADDPELGLGSPDTARELLTNYLTNYIIEKASQELGDCLERRAGTAAEIHALYQEFKDNLRSFIALDLSTLDFQTINWQQAQGADFIRQQMVTAYRLMEDQE